MTRVETPQSKLLAGFARADMTPPVGIYHRMWGAATHDRATGVHRPLHATALALAPHQATANERQIILALDLCLLDDSEIHVIRKAVAEATGCRHEQIQIALSHTHGSGWLSRSRSHLPGGELIVPFFEQLAETCARIATEAITNSTLATIVFGRAICTLAKHRDFYDAAAKCYVCGFNPDGQADDTVLIGKVMDARGNVLGSIVNYACHPTTLAWQNTLISPDYVGAMREVVERETGSPCVFLQGASGDLGPKDGYVGDPAIADRNGRQLGYAVLAGLESLPRPGTYFEYTGPVISGATLGTWEHRPTGVRELRITEHWKCRSVVVELPYRTDLATLEDTRKALAHWESEESRATDPVLRREAHAKVEQMNRQITRLQSLPQGRHYPYRVELWQLGQSIWILVPGELYSEFQTRIRSRFPRYSVIISTITNGWQPGYIPSVSAFGYGIYQEQIATVAPGCLETLIESLTRELKQLIAS